MYICFMIFGDLWAQLDGSRRHLASAESLDRHFTEHGQTKWLRKFEDLVRASFPQDSSNLHRSTDPLWVNDPWATSEPEAEILSSSIGRISGSVNDVDAGDGSFLSDAPLHGKEICFDRGHDHQSCAHDCSSTSVNSSEGHSTIGCIFFDIADVDSGIDWCALNLAFAKLGEACDNVMLERPCAESLTFGAVPQNDSVHSHL